MSVNPVNTFKCSKHDCNNVAINEAVYSLACDNKHKPALSTPLARLCNIHSHGNLWQEFYNKEGWEQIRNAFIGMGKQPPKEKYSSIKIQPIGTAAKYTPQGKSAFTMN
jgi:hypothetical protein